MTKKIVIDTDKKKGQLFHVNEYQGRFKIYKVDVGTVLDDSRKIGEAGSLHDAIAVIKASVGGTVRNVKIV